MIDGQKWQLLLVSRYRDRLRSEQGERSLRSQLMLQRKGQSTPRWEWPAFWFSLFLVRYYEQEKRGKLPVPFLLIPKPPWKYLLRFAFSFNKRATLFQGSLCSLSPHISLHTCMCQFPVLGATFHSTVWCEKQNADVWMRSCLVWICFSKVSLV